MKTNRSKAENNENQNSQTKKRWHKCQTPSPQKKDKKIKKMNTLMGKILLKEKREKKRKIRDRTLAKNCKIKRKNKKKN